MRNREKGIMLMIIIITILIISIIWVISKGKEGKEDKTSNTEFIQVEDDGSKVNTSDKVKETREIEGVTIENIRITEKNGQTELVADATNTTEQIKSRFLVNIILLDKAGNEIGRIPGVIGEMQPGETIEMHAGITEDYANVYDFRIEKK